MIKLRCTCTVHAADIDRPTLPLVTRKGEWTVLIDAQTTLPVGFVPLDSF